LVAADYSDAMRSYERQGYRQALSMFADARGDYNPRRIRIEG